MNTMIDMNGRTIEVGMRAMVMKGVNKGGIGTVRAVVVDGNAMKARVASGEVTNLGIYWSSWLTSRAVAVLPEPSMVHP
jgi:hypothetical protein